MRNLGGAGRLGLIRWIVAAIIAVGPIAPGGALAAESDLAERLCAQRGSGPAIPASAALVAAARTAETQIDSYRQALLPSSRLIPLGAVGQAGDAPSPAAIATYCAAAGETMRIAADGSQAQAIVYLLTAFRNAREAEDRRLAAQSAYRLALVGIADPAVAGTRGGVRSAGAQLSAGAVEATDVAPPAEPGDEDAACQFLEEVGLDRTTAREISEQALGCASELALRAGDARLAALANLRLSLFYTAAADEAGRDADAVRAYARERALLALPLVRTLAGADERATLTARLVESLIGLGAADASGVREAIAELRRNAAGRALADGLAARLALARGDLAAARTSLESAVLAETRRPLPTRLPTWLRLLAQADPDRAQQHIEAAYVALDNLRPLLPRLDPVTEESNFALYMRDVFAAAVESQLAGAGDEARRIRRAQEIVEAYRQAELQSAFGNECLPPRDALRLDQLRPGEIILYPLLLADRVELLYVAGVEGGAPSFRRLAPNTGTNRTEIAKLVESLVLAMGRPGNEDWRPAARRLYDLLIAPVADRLGPDSMLAIVPDGALRALPFAALVGPDGRYLVEQTRLSLIPALAYSQPEGGRRGDRLNVVAASLQQEMALPAGWFGALAGTGREADIAVQYASAGRTIPDFTRAQLVDALNGGRVDVLHLATHAAFNGRSDRAFIVANGEVIRLAELRSIIETSQRRGETLDLIILSACETAVGDDDVSMGLAGAVVQAGARSVIGSLWQVNDLGTAELMTRFYRLYSEGRSRSEALREAQLALLQAGGDQANPNIWAAFALLGAWR